MKLIEQDFLKVASLNHSTKVAMISLFIVFYQLRVNKYEMLK